ncbi:hypothetical protein HAP93_08830 [Acidithiobacillus ferriphilus]|uniref:hypothetical protein n=1 Tax=Acidithiobacillus TaxID=119977 RepID=UPI001C06348A|nr:MULTISPECIES: hypothetical protein [Acidithiobacillus]MBU2785868.1 hypothetical protein [Acidithiobacillus ferriphilus]MBU2829226.1 hypothetical protein [Acidithiobacillus ferriphilus]MDA8246783.1 hypothetical protein [Acidithiobacillus sp.]
MDSFDQTLANHGAAPENLARFDAHSPESLPYVMLTAARQTGNEDLAALSAVSAASLGNNSAPVSLVRENWWKGAD